MKNVNGPFCEKLLVSVIKGYKKKKKKKRSRSNDFGSDEYSYSILNSDLRISEYSDTRSSPINPLPHWIILDHDIIFFLFLENIEKI